MGTPAPEAGRHRHAPLFQVARQKLHAIGEPNRDTPRHAGGRIPQVNSMSAGLFAINPVDKSHRNALNRCASGLFRLSSCPRVVEKMVENLCCTGHERCKTTGM